MLLLYWTICTSWKWDSNQVNFLDSNQKEVNLFHQHFLFAFHAIQWLYSSYSSYSQFSLSNQHPTTKSSSSSHINHLCLCLRWTLTFLFLRRGTMGIKQYEVVLDSLLKRRRINSDEKKQSSWHGLKMKQDQNIFFITFHNEWK